MANIVTTNIKKIMRHGTSVGHLQENAYMHQLNKSKQLIRATSKNIVLFFSPPCNNENAKNAKGLSNGKFK